MYTHTHSLSLSLSLFKLAWPAIQERHHAAQYLLLAIGIEVDLIDIVSKLDIQERRFLPAL